MIIVLARELSAITSWHLEYISAIERLCGSAFSGHHLLAAETVFVPESILNAPSGQFSAVTKAVMQRLLSGFSFQSALTKKTQEFLAITVPSAMTEAQQRLSCSTLSLSSVCHMSLQPTVLLAENSDDAGIYEHAARHYMIENKIRGTQISTTRRGGGGSTIAPEFEEIVSVGREFCVVITDSDKRSPEYGDSETTKRCAAIAKRSPSKAKHFTLPVREVENLIPPAVLRDIVGADVQSSVDRLERLYTEVPVIRECGDIKDGVIGAKALRLPHESSERAILCNAMRCQTQPSEKCLQEEDCAAERNGKECACIAIPKVGAVAPRFENWLSRQSPQKALELFKDQWREKWLDIGSRTFYWCCAGPRMRD